MIGLYTPEQMREMDSFLIDGGTISGYALMNNAASAALDAIIRLIPDLYQRPVVIFCGKGNNGGDGLCILRMLHVSGCDVKALLMTDSFSGDAGMAFDDAVRSGCSMTRFAPGERFGENAVIIDALFGTGLNRELHGTFPEAIEAINLSGARIVSIDIPSGINGENGQIMGCAVRAHATVTFQYLKPGLLLFPGRSYAGRVITVSIDDRYPKPETAMYTLEAGDIRSWIPEQQADDYKGKNGKALILAGSRNYAGAALMCTASALRTGAGLTYCAVPHDLKTQFSALPEAISVPLGLEGEDSWTAECCRGARELLLGKDVICAGPGMGRIEDPGLIADVLKTGIPCVLDADALNCVAANRELLDLFHSGVVITPHVGEMSRLTGESISDIQSDPVRAALVFSKHRNCVTVLKGATSCISNGSQCVLNTTGNPGLAKGGSGDVLSGIITALLALKLEPFRAAAAGSYLLGASAETALELLKARAMIAGDVISAIRETVEKHLND
ncbi:MAG: NAD(P)H-hydrate dehydratase [Clostridia bacterium]|nr:NAD(P)H-hydrate dehydratase [Clostridia bacterium]